MMQPHVQRFFCEYSQGDLTAEVLFCTSYTL